MCEREIERKPFDNLRGEDVTYSIYSVIRGVEKKTKGQNVCVCAPILYTAVSCVENVSCLATVDDVVVVLALF